jgi:hypothetical protein
MTFWSNRLRISDNYLRYCSAFLNANMASSFSGNAGLITIYIITGILHAAFVIAFIPALVFTFLTRWRIMRVFERIPKRTVSEIYYQVKSTVTKHTKKITLPYILSYHKAIVFTVAMVIIELCIIGCIIGDNNYKITTYSGAYNLVQNTALMNSQLRRVHFEMGELILQTVRFF